MKEIWGNFGKVAIGKEVLFWDEEMLKVGDIVLVRGIGEKSDLGWPKYGVKVLDGEKIGRLEKKIVCDQICWVVSPFDGDMSIMVCTSGGMGLSGSGCFYGVTELRRSCLYTFMLSDGEAAPE